jgi:hypothetical protein
MVIACFFMTNTIKSCTGWWIRMLQGHHGFIPRGTGIGGLGFAARLAKDDEVTICDNHSRNSLQPCGVVNLLDSRFVQGEIRDVNALTAATKPADHVPQCAGIAATVAVARNTVKVLEVCMVGSVQVIHGLANTMTRVPGPKSCIVCGETKSSGIELRVSCVYRANGCSVSSPESIWIGASWRQPHPPGSSRACNLIHKWRLGSAAKHRRHLE